MERFGSVGGSCERTKEITRKRRNAVHSLHNNSLCDGHFGGHFGGHNANGPNFGEE